MPASSPYPLPAESAISDCWNKIGVQGNRSCPELIPYIHCHNCPVYSAAARTFLDRELPPDHLDQWAHHFAREESSVEVVALSLVLFRIGAEWFGLPPTVFKEISELKPIHSLPHRRNNLILGLVNFRGELLICVSLARMLKTGTSDNDSKTGYEAHPYLLSVSHAGNRFVFPVDEIGGIHHFNEKEMKQVPVTVAGTGKNYARGILIWRTHAIGCLDAGLLFSSLEQSLS